MIPRWHILWGAVFTIAFWLLAQDTSLFNLFLILFSSIFLDLDHYLSSLFKTKKLSLQNSFKYHSELEKEIQKNQKKGIRKKYDFHIFHTFEFHLIIALLGIYWVLFFYILIGMVFHSILDIFSMVQKDRLYVREFFLFNLLRKKIKQN